MVSTVDRLWVSRYSTPTFAISVYRDGEPGSADDPVTARLFVYDEEGMLASVPVWERIIDETPGSPGLYEVVLSSADTQTMGDYELRYDYEVDSVAEVYAYDFEIGPPAHAYDALDPDWQATVDAVWMRFADLFDSPYGGPNLQVYMQTHFGRNRIAQLLPTALNTLNTATLGHQMYAVNGENFPFSEWGGLLQTSLYIEVVKHLIRSYTEQPEVILGTAVSRVDRRDYMQRWQEVLNGELETFNRDLSRYKMANLGLGNVHVLVSGGAFGKLGPYVNAGGAGAAAARGYFAIRRWH